MFFTRHCCQRLIQCFFASAENFADNLRAQIAVNRKHNCGSRDGLLCIRFAFSRISGRIIHLAVANAIRGNLLGSFRGNAWLLNLGVNFNRIDFGSQTFVFVLVLVLIRIIGLYFSLSRGRFV